MLITLFAIIYQLYFIFVVKYCRECSSSSIDLDKKIHTQNQWNVKLAANSSIETKTITFSVFSIVLLRVFTFAHPWMANLGAIMMTKDEWSAEEELQLFHAMDGLRPVGINKHFYMSCISERLSKSLNREMPSDLIWKHLSTMYKLKELDEQECLPFPNEEREFSLPEQDYATFLNKKSSAVNVTEETSESQVPLGMPVAAAANENNTKGKIVIVSKQQQIIIISIFAFQLLSLLLTPLALRKIVKRRPL